MKIGEITIKISRCTTGVYLRWWFNGWHYYNFTDGYEITKTTESKDTQVTRLFSVISKVERPSKLTTKYAYRITVEGITEDNILGFTGILLAERVDQYEGGIWREVDITREDHHIKDEGTNGYVLSFEVSRKELPITSSVYQKYLRLYIGDTLCDLDDDEVIPINKQTNDIAEMQDRQSDFTAQFRIRKTREMKALFELSGETGINTYFPYQKQSCKLIQEGIEMITSGEMILDRADDQYYYVSILSGNLNFFKDIENLKLSDLLLPTTDHDWTIANQKASHDNDYDYLYPLCEPSDDGGIAPLRLVGETVEMFGGWIWPFVKVKTIWDEIFTGYYCEGDILTNDIFLKLWMPITNLNITKEYTNKYLYSVWWGGARPAATQPLAFAGAVLINGDADFQDGHYVTPFTATYRITVITSTDIGDPVPTLELYEDGVSVDTFTLLSVTFPYRTYEVEYAAASGVDLQVYTIVATYYRYYSIAITEIADAQIGYGSSVTPRLHLPDMTQTDFIKMICNMFGLIPDYFSRDRRIRFWNYSDLYDNIPVARDWSSYLSERDDEVEFKFGDYAQNNYLKYSESDDVITDNGKGTMLLEDETLPIHKDVVEIPVSTCDEVNIATTTPMTVSRITFNEFHDPTLADFQQWEQQDSIDSRIVYCKQSVGQLFRLWNDDAMTVGSVDIDDPKIASSHEIAFSSLVVNYANLSRMLTRTNLRRAKFNLPVYEVAELKHYTPIYLRQYKAYFYVNKINNYVPGQLCTIDLIKL